jgi:SRSO17 transposase
MMFIRRFNMDVNTVKSIGKELKQFLKKFDGCFSRSEPRESLQIYVQGQLSDLERKSIEPIALAAGIPPRTLQYFLSSAQWNHPLMCDRIQQVVAAEHAHPQAIGVIDESANPKKGWHTCGAQRQWCGNLGKVDNCVVGVHLGYVYHDFQCLIDSDLFLPEDWINDLDLRRETKVPEEIVFRTKPEIALEQVTRALHNGICFSALTFDELYGRSGPFLDGLGHLGQNYVGEIPSDFVGWLKSPQILTQPTAPKKPKKGRKRRYPRLAKNAGLAREVRNLVAYSPVFQKQKWQRFRIKDGEKGPVVWEVKFAKFYRKQGDQGLPRDAHTLIVARNVLDVNEVKYFLTNMSLGTRKVSLQWLLWVAFSRWPIERCFEIGKRELGMDHFEVRFWDAIHRHFYISQLSQLFCARVQQSLRKKNSGEFIPDCGAGTHGRFSLDYRALAEYYH